MTFFSTSRRNSQFWYGSHNQWLLRILAATFLIIVLTSSLHAATYVEGAKAMLRNLPEDAQLRSDLESELVAQANAYRASKGVGGLEPSNLLREAARAQAADMMLNNYVGHRSKSGYEFDSRVRYFLGNPPNLPQMAENAARETQKGEANAAKAGRLFQQWVHSAPHRKSLINSGYKFVSTGVVQRGNKIWAVQIFWAPMPDTAGASGILKGLY
jgi:uncharacterized protein YkwD